MDKTDPDTSRLATIGNAADEGSPGTTISFAISSGCPCSRTTRPAPPRVGSTERVAPKCRSMFSLWSRVAAGSSTRVIPGAFRPHSNTALFTWAEATGST